MQKEFIQAVHIDLLAFLFLFHFLVISNEKRNHLIGIALSVWTKVIGIFALPFVLFEDKKITVKKTVWVLGIPLSLGLFFYFMMVILPGEDAYSGVKAFSGQWEWNSGFYSLLKNIIKVPAQVARKMTLGFFVGFYFLVFALFWQRKIKLNGALLLVYSSLMFFSPVYNGWYSIWFLPFALREKSLMGVLFACASSFGYIGWGDNNPFHWRLAELRTHIFFLGLLIEKWKRPA